MGRIHLFLQRTKKTMNGVETMRSSSSSTGSSSNSNLDGSEQAFEITMASTRIWQELQGSDSAL